MNSFKLGFGLLFFLLCGTSIGQAQTAPSELKGYTPPPMFGAQVHQSVPQPQIAPASTPIQIIARPHVAALPIKNPVPGLKAEDLINHPVTSQGEEDPAMMAAPINSLPASAISNDLPVPVGGTSASPIKYNPPHSSASANPVKKATKKSRTKKAESKKSTPKETQSTPQTEVSKPATAVKTQTKLTVPTPSVPAPLIAKPVDKKPDTFHLQGKKNMPTATPTKVDRVQLNPATLPVPQSVSPTVSPAPVIPAPAHPIAVAPIAPAVPAAIVAPSPAPPITPPPLSSTDKTSSPLISLEFKPDVYEVQPDQKKILESEILPNMTKDKTGSLQILSYASPSTDSTSSARRMSLSRALSLRSYLLDKGIDPARIEIRALGDSTNQKPLDRIDLLIVHLK